MTESERIEEIRALLAPSKQTSYYGLAQEQQETSAKLCNAVPWMLSVIAERDAEIERLKDAERQTYRDGTDNIKDLTRMAEMRNKLVDAELAAAKAEIAKLHAALTSLVEHSRNAAEALDGYFGRRIVGPVLGLDLPQDDPRVGVGYTCYYPRIEGMKLDASDRVCLGCGKEAL